MARKGSIEDIGPEQWLNLKAPEHGGLDYAAFRRMRDTKVSIASMARAFGVQPNTIRKWVLLDDKQRSTAA